MADVVTEAIMIVSIVTQTCAECREAAQSPAEECGKSVLYKYPGPRHPHADIPVNQYS